MERFHPICDARSRVSRNISYRSKRLARSGAVPGMDAEDIKQDLRLHLYRRDGSFDPSRGEYDTFADRVLANRIFDPRRARMPIVRHKGTVLVT